MQEPNREKIKAAFQSINELASGDPAALDFVKLCACAHFGFAAELNAILDHAKDRQTRNGQISDAVELMRGKGFTLTGHGVTRTIDARFTDLQKAAIVRALRKFGDILWPSLGVEVFLTSGTLLGLVRDGVFLPHDDDFDVAYISRHPQSEEWVNERRALFDTVNSHAEFEMQERTGGRAAVFFKSDEVKFNFDCFTAFRDGEFLNEFPLKPKAIPLASVSPLKTVEFYGEKINIPNTPEDLLEVNYGPGWREPDPTFRFNFGKYKAFYSFVTKNKLTDR